MFLSLSMRVRRTNAFAASISRATVRHACLALAIVAFADAMTRPDCSTRFCDCVTVVPLSFDEEVHRAVAGWLRKVASHYHDLSPKTESAVR